MSDMTKPPKCAGECIRCGRIAMHWFCDICLRPAPRVNRHTPPRVVIKHRIKQLQPLNIGEYRRAR